MGSGEKFAAVGEGERRAWAFKSYGIDEVAGWKVPDADHRVHGSGNDPAAVIRKAEIADLTHAAPEFSYKLLGLGIDYANREIVAAEGDEIAGAVVLGGCDGGHGRPVDFGLEMTGLEVPKFEFAVEAAAD